MVGQGAALDPRAYGHPLIGDGGRRQALQIHLAAPVRGRAGSQHQPLGIDDSDAAQKRQALEPVGQLCLQLFGGAVLVHQAFGQTVQGQPGVVEGVAGMCLHCADQQLQMPLIPGFGAAKLQPHQCRCADKHRQNEQQAGGQHFAAGLAQKTGLGGRKRALHGKGLHQGRRMRSRPWRRAALSRRPSCRMRAMKLLSVARHWASPGLLAWA